MHCIGVSLPGRRWGKREELVLCISLVQMLIFSYLRSALTTSVLLFFSSLTLCRTPVVLPSYSRRTPSLLQTFFKVMVTYLQSYQAHDYLHSFIYS